MTTHNMRLRFGPILLAGMLATVGSAALGAFHAGAKGATGTQALPAAAMTWTAGVSGCGA